MKSFRLFGLVALFGVFSGLVFGCTIRSTYHSSSVVQYLYPDQKIPVETPQIPRLSLPIKVGIAFVPETTGRHYNLTEKDKTDLMKEVSDHFRQYDFVRSIEIIPSSYLTPKGGFTNLDQIRTMFNVDVIALISYDQTQFTDEGLASITYWTLIGAYTIPGEKNSTHTMVDAAVYDIASRKMLFRAPGVSHIKSTATPVNLTEQLRKDSLNSFKEASRDLINNLDEQLSLFKERVKASPQEFQVVRSPGYRGGGSVDAVFLGLLLGLGGWRLWTQKKKKI
jgi:rhombotail lipoprotein